MRLCAGHPAQPSTLCMPRGGPPITQRTSGLDSRAALDPPHSNANFTDIVDKAIAGAAGPAKIVVGILYTSVFGATDRKFGLVILMRLTQRWPKNCVKNCIEING